MKRAKFSIGQCIQHCMYDYRGVIVDADPEFFGTDEWYEQVATSRPPKDEPWYHVLVHDGGRETYVAERNLVLDDSNEPVDHPLVHEFLHEFEHGHYQSNRYIN